MKQASHIAAGLLGLGFIIFGFNFFYKFIPMGDRPAAGSPAALFWGAVAASGFMAFVKVLEIIGGVLVALPKTRNLGLLIIGPIVVNILAYNIFIAGGGAVFQPPVILFSALAAFVLWTKRETWLTLIKN